MGHIQVLPFEVANLIAAGEVVDRPASAIKEMMENAIDADAAHVTVEIQNGGVSFMRVSDDGCGMSAEDLPMAIRRHATSKIRNASDLDGIITLGFRGEALAAISSVSDMRIMSKRPEDETGHMLEVRGGALLGVQEYGCRDGTTVIAEHLFANVPARRKFLKRDATESMAVSANVERVALSHPEIAFRLIVDGVPKMETAGDGKLQSAIWAVFGREFASRLIPLDAEYDGIRIEGFIGRSDNVKATRNGQNFFINHRYIKSRTAQAALEQAYTSYLPQDKYPCCVLNIGLNPARVDVNVHPAKLEVKFSNEKPVFEAVYYAVRQALEQDTGRPTLRMENTRTGGLAGSFSGRLSDAKVPVDAEPPEPLRKRQVTVDTLNTVTGASGQHPAAQSAGTVSAGTGHFVPKKPLQERITAEEYVARYVKGQQGKGKEKAADIPQTVGIDVSSSHRSCHPQDEALSHPPCDRDPDRIGNPTPRSDSLPADIPDLPDIPMEVYEAEARQLTAEEPVSPETEPADIQDHVYAVPAQPADEGTVSPDVGDHADRADDVAQGTVPADITPWRIIGEAFHAYILVEQQDRLLLIDKHAAHERIIFEQLKTHLRQSLAGQGVDAQLMLLPIDVMLMSGEVDLINAYRTELEAIGFSFSCLRNTVRVDAIPSGIETGAVPDMISAFAEQLGQGTGDPKITRDILFEKALYQASCKAAIKAGREYPPEQEAWVVEQLMRLPDITFCPHGRPVAMEMKKRNIDHQFERC